MGGGMGGGEGREKLCKSILNYKAKWKKKAVC